MNNLEVEEIVRRSYLDGTSASFAPAQFEVFGLSADEACDCLLDLQRVGKLQPIVQVLEKHFGEWVVVWEGDPEVYSRHPKILHSAPTNIIFYVSERWARILDGHKRARPTLDTQTPA